MGRKRIPNQKPKIATEQKGYIIMSTSIEHKSTAKSFVRNLFLTYGTAGALQLISDVLRENVGGGKGRPTVDETPFVLAIKSLSALVPQVEAALNHAADVATDRNRPKRKYTRKEKAGGTVELA